MSPFRLTQNIVSLFFIASITACATAPAVKGALNEEEAESICSNRTDIRDYDRQLEKLDKKATHTARILARGQNLEDAERVDELCREELKRDLQMGKEAVCILEREDEDGETYCEEYETPRCGAIFQDIDIDVKEAQLQDLTVQISQIKTARGTAYAKCLASMPAASP